MILKLTSFYTYTAIRCVDPRLFEKWSRPNMHEFPDSYGYNNYFIEKTVLIIRDAKQKGVGPKYCIEGNFGRDWRIWQMTINLPKVNPSIFILD